MQQQFDSVIVGRNTADEIVYVLEARPGLVAEPPLLFGRLGKNGVVKFENCHVGFVFEQK